MPMPLNYRDRRKRGTPWRSWDPGICTDHGRRRWWRRCTWPNDQARCVSRTMQLLLILPVFFLLLSIPLSSQPSLPSPPPSPPPPSNMPQLICMSREAFNWRSERGFFPYRETQRDSASSVLATHQLDVYLGKLYRPRAMHFLARISRCRGKKKNGLWSGRRIN